MEQSPENFAQQQQKVVTRLNHFQALANPLNTRAKTAWLQKPADLQALSASVISTSAGGTAAMYWALLGRAGSTNSCHLGAG